MNEDLLVLTHKGGMVKMYSLSWMIENCTILPCSLGDIVELKEEAWVVGRSRTGAVGNPGFDIPCTVKLTGKSKMTKSRDTVVCPQ